jgi:hypothetical protein
LPIHREEAATMCRSELANLEYQNVRPWRADCREVSPGLISRARTNMPMTMRIPATATGSATFELEALLADASGPEADCGLLPTGPFPGSGFGNAAFPELGTSGVTLVGTVVLGATAFGVAAMAARVGSRADLDAEV